MRGGVEFIAGAQSAVGGSGSHFFGPNANNFVVGAPIDNEPDNYTDLPIDPTGLFTGQDPEDGYLYDGSFGTHHVANLVSETPQVPSERTTRHVQGFMVGLAESPSEAVDPAQVGSYILSDSYGGDQPISPNFEMSLSAENNTLTANATLFDALNDSNLVDYFEIAFGDAAGGQQFVCRR